MLENHIVQNSIFHFHADHEIGQELLAISNWPDIHPEVLDWVKANLQPLPVADCGRKGLPVESCRNTIFVFQAQIFHKIRAQLRFLGLKDSICDSDLFLCYKTDKMNRLNLFISALYIINDNLFSSPAAEVARDEGRQKPLLIRKHLIS